MLRFQWILFYYRFRLIRVRKASEIVNQLLCGWGINGSTKKFFTSYKYDCSGHVDNERKGKEMANKENNLAHTN